MASQREGGIAWTEETWNPIRGCSRVSEGCRHCYAERVATRFSGPGQPYEGLVDVPAGGRHGESGVARTGVAGRWNGVLKVVERHLEDPLRWKRPRRVFVNSMSDLFHEALADEVIDRIFAVMALAPQHTFQCLTKRADRMRSYITNPDCRSRVSKVAAQMEGDPSPEMVVRFWPLLNVWLGVSVEDQPTADARIPLLLQTPAAVRFVSAEPLLGPVDLRPYLVGHEEHGIDLSRPVGSKVGCCVGWTPALDWVIPGGESGGQARACDLAWIRAIVAHCRAAGVACFVKQLGSRPFSEHGNVDIPRRERAVGRPDRPAIGFRSPKAGDPAEWPDDLRVREYPDDCA